MKQRTIPLFFCWDMLCDMKKGGEIYADGELVYKDGKFLI
jgi:aminopeptidase